MTALLPACMMPDGADPCTSFTILQDKVESQKAEIERLRAEVLQCSAELGEAVKLLAPHYPGMATIYDMACGRARVAIGLTPCDPHEQPDHVTAAKTYMDEAKRLAEDLRAVGSEHVHPPRRT